MGNRGTFGSFGASLSLIAAGVLALVLLTSLVAYHGWPGMRAASAEHVVSLPVTPPRDTANGDAPAHVVRIAARIPQAHHAAAGRHHHSATRSAARSGLGATAPAQTASKGRRSDEQVRSLAATPAPTAHAAPAATSTPAPVAAVPSPVQQAVDQVTDTVKDVGHGVSSVGEVADSLLPQP